MAEGLEATLFAAEPLLSSPSDIDVDSRGRVWLCEVLNYRGKKDTRPEGDRILVLEDTDGDGRADFNFGNTGRAVHDRDANPVKDRFGNEVNNSGKPYREDMVFRCRPDGTDFEVLGHNFRNNYEVAVDSFGTLWQRRPCGPRTERRTEASATSGREAAD